MDVQPEHIDDEDIAYVVGELACVIDPETMMLVGARCRDIYQRHFRSTSAGRITRDIDFGVAIDSWEGFRELKRRFSAPAVPWQEITIDGLRIDLIPFGEVEDPPGEISHDGGFTLNVAGFGEVFASARTVDLPNGVGVKVPTVPGFAALKLHAWCDRWPVGKYKDASDIALVLAWYEEDEELWDRYMANWAEFLGEPDLMSAYLLGIDVASVLGERETAALSARFTCGPDEGINKLAEQLTAPGEHIYPVDRRRAQIEALLQAMGDSAPER